MIIRNNIFTFRKSTATPNTKEKKCHIKSSRYRLKTQGGTFPCFQRQTVSSDSDEVKEEEQVEDEPTLSTTSEKIDRLSVEETTEAPSPASDQTFNVGKD
ncbi:hypothetical protein ACTXT7_016826 [Hymenolepis weldensis]